MHSKADSARAVSAFFYSQTWPRTDIKAKRRNIMDVYQIVTEKIISMLERGTVPWRKCWQGCSGMPRNVVSKKEYRGVNVFLLSAMPYSSQYWLTFKQAQDLGGYVRKGEKSSMVVFWKMLDKREEEEAVTAKGKIPMLRYYQLFSVEQCEGIPEPRNCQSPLFPLDHQR